MRDDLIEQALLDALAGNAGAKDAEAVAVGGAGGCGEGVLDAVGEERDAGVLCGVRGPVREHERVGRRRRRARRSSRWRETVRVAVRVARRSTPERARCSSPSDEAARRGSGAVACDYRRVCRSQEASWARPRGVEAGLPEWCSVLIAPQSAPAWKSPSSERSWISMRRSSSVAGGILIRRIDGKCGERGG
jgi:hypothetical protein